jgi:hypothetical protein
VTIADRTEAIENNPGSLADSDCFLSASYVIELPTLQFFVDKNCDSSSSKLASIAIICFSV